MKVITIKNSRQTPLLWLFLFSSVISSCNKNEITYDFSGQVTDQLTNAPLADVEFKLSQKTVQNSGTTPDFMFVGSDITDNQGNYDVTIDRDKVTSFYMSYEKPLYFPLEFEETSANVSTEEINVYNRPLEPQAWIEFDLENFGPSEDDHLKLLTQQFREGCDGCGENTTYEYFGALDTSIVYLTTAGEYVKFTLINVNTGFSQFDSLLAAPFDTATYVFNY